MSELPTRDEYANEPTIILTQTTSEWSEPKYKCPKCGEGGMCKNLRYVLASNPARYKYRCDTCGYIDYQFR